MPKNVQTTALISRASTVMLKILQALLQQCMHQELPDNLDLEKAEESDIILLTSFGSQKTARKLQKKIYISIIDYAKAFDCVGNNKPGKFLTCLLRSLYAGQETIEQDME